VVSELWPPEGKRKCSSGLRFIAVDFSLLECVYDFYDDNTAR